MSTPESATAVIGWNLSYRARPAEQHARLQILEERARANGAGVVLFCLSELTSPLSSRGARANDTLQEVLEADGYSVNSRHTTLFRDNRRSEGIAFASRDQALTDRIANARFYDTISQKANWFKLANWHYTYREQRRRIGSVVLDDLDVFTTHASYHSPDLRERQAILRRAGEAAGKKLLIGDFNTGLNQRLIREARSAGWEKLVDPNSRTTFPLRPGRLPINVRGLELDHALVTPELKAISELEIGAKGPSDHHPLTVLIAP